MTLLLIQTRSSKGAQRDGPASMIPRHFATPWTATKHAHGFRHRNPGQDRCGKRLCPRGDIDASPIDWCYQPEPLLEHNIPIERRAEWPLIPMTRVL
jgi:hypothetical protein